MYDGRYIIVEGLVWETIKTTNKYYIVLSLMQIDWMMIVLWWNLVQPCNWSEWSDGMFVTEAAIGDGSSMAKDSTRRGELFGVLGGGRWLLAAMVVDTAAMVVRCTEV